MDDEAAQRASDAAKRANLEKWMEENSDRMLELKDENQYLFARRDGFRCWHNCRGPWLKWTRWFCVKVKDENDQWIPRLLNVYVEGDDEEHPLLPRFHGQDDFINVELGLSFEDAFQQFYERSDVQKLVEKGTLLPRKYVL